MENTASTEAAGCRMDAAQNAKDETLSRMDGGQEVKKAVLAEGRYMRYVRVICVPVLLFSMVGNTLAAGSDWAAVQRLALGDRVEVKLTDGRTLLSG